MAGAQIQTDAVVAGVEAATDEVTQEHAQQQSVEVKAQEVEQVKVSPLSYAIYYAIYFFAFWFGSQAFDVEGDGDFDARDVQLRLRALLREKARRAGVVGRPEDDVVPKERDGNPLDRNSDGVVDLDDILQNEVEGPAQEIEAMKSAVAGKSRPWFVMIQVVVICSLWFVFAIVSAVGEGTNFLTSKGGLDSMFEGQTNLVLADSDCNDLRTQVWRWLTYQFTHLGITHVAATSFMTIVFGLPLEMMHGSMRAARLFNIGVLGGALCYMVFDAHLSLVGCSGGCYAFIGAHVADLIINWSQKRFRLPTMVLIFSVVAVDILAYVFGNASEESQTANVGGAIAGLLLGVFICKNIKVKRFEYLLMATTLVIAAFLAVGCIAWMATRTNGPQNLLEASAGVEGWCWVRVILDARINAQSWECIRCGTSECIERFQSFEKVRTVSLSYCDAKGYWNN